LELEFKYEFNNQQAFYVQNLGNAVKGKHFQIWGQM